MLARHDGQVVFVWGAIPGERVRAHVTRVQKRVGYADTAEVLEASADRRDPGSDWRCGGNVFAHVAYPRQLQLKGQILQDALARIGRVKTDAPQVLGSPEHGYRMRARFHAARGRLGFFREDTHELCDAASTGQLLPATSDWLASVAEALRGNDAVTGLEMAENVAGDERACHVELRAGAETVSVAHLASVGPLAGLSASRADRGQVDVLAGTPRVSDVLRATDDRASGLQLRRDVRAFFQGNRFLLEPLVRRVAALVPPGPVVELYAGVGLFGLSLAAAGAERVTMVEADPVSASDLRGNAEPFGDRVRTDTRSVEEFLRTTRGEPGATVIVDPPRTGLSKDALAGLVARRPSRLVYVSCDPATLARDARALLEAGYGLESLSALDLFPNTAHVESVAAFTR